MKKITIFILSVLLVFVFACKRETRESAIKYNNEIVGYQENVDNKLVDLVNEIDMGSYESMQEAYKIAKEAVNEAVKNVEAMRKFDDKEDLKNAMLELLKMYESIIDEDIPVLMGYSKNFDSLTDAEYEEYISLYDELLNKYNSAFDKFDKVLNEFAEQWDLDSYRQK